MGGGNFVKPGQASGMGGADKPAGAQGKNTFQNKNLKQLVLLVYYKPAPVNDVAAAKLGDASSMLSGITGAIDGAVDAVEGAMDSIPGLKMFIKEDKKNSTSEKDYKNDFSQWDSALSAMGNNLKDINSENLTDTFTYSSTDADGRKKDAQKLLDQIKSKISAWKKYTAQIHFIGLGQGGNVINECTDLIAKDSDFAQEKWNVKSVIYVGTTLYKNLHVLNTAAFRGDGDTFAFSSAYDLTQHGIDYFEPTDKLLQMIKDANSNTLSLAVGKVKLHVIRILSILLSGLSIGTGDHSQLDKFDLIKQEVEGMVNDIISIIKKLASDTASFVKIDKLPEFSKIADGYPGIPRQAKIRVDDFLRALHKKVEDDIDAHGLSLKPNDLALLLNCFCPLLDAITASLSIFKYESKTSNDLSQQIIDSAGVKKIYAPMVFDGEDLRKVDPYWNKEKDKVTKEHKPDMAATFITTTQDFIAKASETATDVSALTDEQKTALGEALFCMIRPMIPSKDEVYKQLIEIADKFLHFDSLFEDISMTKLMSFPAGPLKSLDIDYPDDLKASIAGTDNEIKRIKGFFDKDNFAVQDDSMYFTYNSRNKVLEQMYPAIAYRIDSQTGYLDYMKSKGQDSNYPIDGSKGYSLATGGKPKENVLPAQKIPEGSTK